MTKNAIILAAGKSNRFAPFTYEKPKGLFCVKGEVLIERQIEQLIQAGISEIYIVVGYMKEKFFYLEQKYTQVRLLVNNNFSVKGNLYSLYVARNYLNNSFICYADYYFVKNPFTVPNDSNVSFHTVVKCAGKDARFSACYSDAKVLTSVDFGSHWNYSLLGYAYFNCEFSHQLRKFLNKEISEFRVSSLFWEEYFNRHIKELTLYAKEFPKNSIIEFDSIDDLRHFDSDFLFNVDSEIIQNICNVLGCHPNNIINISVINSGLTNVSFSFSAQGKNYVYRHPGANAENLIDRTTEIFSQMKAKELGLDNSVIQIDKSGWKISHLIENLTVCDFEKFPWQKQKLFEHLRKIHAVTPDSSVKIFDVMDEGKRLFRLSCPAKGNLFREFSTMLEKLENLDALLKEDSRQNGFSWVLSHGDVYEPNFLATENKDLYLIDWEYSGIHDPAFDINSIITRRIFTNEQIESYWEGYFRRPLTHLEHRHFYCQLPITAFYWFCWGIYKGSIGDDDGFFFLDAYRNICRFLDTALKEFEK